jgi:hypothetical protein
MRSDPIRRLALLTVLVVLAGLRLSLAGQPGDPGMTGLLFPPWTHVRAASTTAITLSNPGTDAFDGVLLETTDPAINRRVLVWQQENAAENGIYQWNSSSTAMTRVSDMNEAREFVPNMLIFVRGGLTYHQSFFSLAHDTPLAEGTLGTTGITYSPVGISSAALSGMLSDVLGDLVVLTDPDTGLLENPNVLPYPELLLAEPGPGTCQSFIHWMMLPHAGGPKTWLCPSGLGSNAEDPPGRPALRSVCVGDDCLHCTEDEPDCQLDIVGGAGLTCALTGTPPVMVVTCTPVSGTRSVWVPASAMSSSGACSDPTEAALLTNGPKRYSVTCTDDDTASVEFDLGFTTADNWNSSTVQIQVYGYSVTNQNAEVVALDFAGQCRADGAAVAAHSTTGQQRATITHGNQAADLQISAATSAITLNGTCTQTSHLFFRGQIDATATTFSPMSDWRLLGVKIIYSTN